MKHIVDLFEKENNVPLSFRKYVNQPSKSVDEKVFIKFVRARDGLTFSNPTFYFCQFHGSKIKRLSNPQTWDIDLNEMLLDKKIMAITVENESERFVLVIKSDFKQIENNYGDGFFNASIIKLLKGVQFKQFKCMQLKVNKIYDSKPSLRQKEYSDLCERIVANISEILQKLVSMGYSKSNALKVVDSALAQYLDERFHVTNRTLLNLK